MYWSPQEGFLLIFINPHKFLFSFLCLSRLYYSYFKLILLLFLLFLFSIVHTYKGT